MNDIFECETVGSSLFSANSEAHSCLVLLIESFRSLQVSSVSKDGLKLLQMNKVLSSSNVFHHERRVIPTINRRSTSTSGNAGKKYTASLSPRCVIDGSCREEHTTTSPKEKRLFRSVVPLCVLKGTCVRRSRISKIQPTEKRMMNSVIIPRCVIDGSCLPKS